MQCTLVFKTQTVSFSVSSECLFPLLVSCGWMLNSTSRMHCSSLCITQHVYWSDVRERTIHRVNRDGSNSLILLDSSRGIGVVDGMN